MPWLNIFLTKFFSQNNYNQLCVGVWGVYKIGAPHSTVKFIKEVKQSGLYEIKNN